MTAYTLNLFYREGTFFWDPGLFVHLTAFSDVWPMLWPDFLHRDLNAPRETFFGIHFMPLLYLTSSLYKLVSFIPPATYLSILQGLWSGLIGLSVFMLCARSGGFLLAMAAGLTTGLSGPILAALGYPHVEPAIPALLLMFFALRSTGHRLGAYMALGLCLMVREDAGLHAAAFLTLLAAGQWLSRQPRGAVLVNLATAAVCVAYALAALSLPIVWFPRKVSLLETVFIGRPLLSHVTWSLISERTAELFSGRAYVSWPLVALLWVALWRRNLLLLAGAVAPMPWVILLVLAVQKDVTLWGYYSFPLIVTLAWPAIVLGTGGARIVCGLSSLSILLFVALSGPNPDRSPWRLFRVPDFAAIGSYERALQDAVGRRDELGRLAVDDAVVTLISNSLKTDEWVLQWAIDKLPNPDAVIFNETVKGPLDTKAAVDEAIKASGLTYRCRIGDTPFVVASRTKTSLCR